MSSVETIVSECLKGNRKSQRVLYESNRRDLYFTSVRYTRSAEDAKDVLQESFVQIFRDLHQFDVERGALKTWMNRIVINTALRFYRKNDLFLKSTKVATEDVHFAEEQDEFQPERFSTREILKGLQSLPHGYRTVFNLYVLEGYSHPEIAEYLGISVNTSKSQLSKAKAALRTFLQGTRKQKFIALL